MWKTTQLKIQNIIGKPVPIQEHFYIAKLCYSVIKLFFFQKTMWLQLMANQKQSNQKMVTTFICDKQIHTLQIQKML
jgi:hypothetical protein